MTKHCRLCGRFIENSRLFICRECTGKIRIPPVILEELIKADHIKLIKHKDMTEEEVDLLYMEQLRQFDGPCLKDFYDVEYVSEINAQLGGREKYVDYLVGNRRKESDANLERDWDIDHGDR